MIQFAPHREQIVLPLKRNQLVNIVLRNRHCTNHTEFRIILHCAGKVHTLEC
jgi:hypothetical protein